MATEVKYDPETGAPIVTKKPRYDVNTGALIEEPEEDTSPVSRDHAMNDLENCSTVEHLKRFMRRHILPLSHPVKSAPPSEG